MSFHSLNRIHEYLFVFIRTRLRCCTVKGEGSSCPFALENFASFSEGSRVSRLINRKSSISRSWGYSAMERSTFPRRTSLPFRFYYSNSRELACERICRRCMNTVLFSFSLFLFFLFSFCHRANSSVSPGVTARST